MTQAIDSKPIYALLFSDGSPEGVVISRQGAFCWDRTNKAMYVKSTEGTTAGWVKQLGTGSGGVDGLDYPNSARATFDPSAIAGHRTIAAHGLGVTIPDNAIITGGFYTVDTTFTSATDAATIAIKVEAANDIVSAIAISNGGNPWDSGKHAIIPKSNTPESTSVTLTAAREITTTVAVEALTAGKLVIFLTYIIAN